ncbi:hypothetical protein D7V88_20630 [Corallococcus terminator]|uniref:HEAT repeat domain-containing protein n=2 Tax=Corallococcus terminator TaxID=2316733 RepID=A0A3A8J3E3_9BACT|nr:hypothetical protein D7V88_20630 [Corallococcus terminator]
MLHANHGISELSGEEMRQSWEAVRRNPQPHLPYLRSRATLSQLDAAQDPLAFQASLKAISYLLVLGQDAERQQVVELLREVQREQDVVSAQVATLARGRNIASMSPDEQPGYRAQVVRMNRLLDAEGFIVRAFAAVGDARLRDLLLPRLDSSELRNGYIDYLTTTGLQDPVVRARLKMMLEGSPSPVTEQHLRRFFAQPQK